jgi:tetratricopeptide (TPR) repeat protein/nucleoside phosphorylase
MHQAHVVILTAISLEYQAAKQVDAGAWEGSRWEEAMGPNALPVAFRTFRGKGGRPLRVMVAQSGDMGGVAAVNALVQLVDKYKPRCVAMCGVCAGHPGKTNLGDVIAPERLFFHDTGKREPDGVKQDLKMYNLRDDWKVALEHFDFAARFQNEHWWKKRPVPYEWQENWVLAMLQQGVADPAAHPEREMCCPQWGTVIKALWQSGHVQPGTLSITEEGRGRIRAILIEHLHRFPDLSPAGEVLPFKVHVAPMGSGNHVVEDEQIWDFISEHMRKTLGLDMESAAIGAVAHAQRDKHLETVVMKGVMDFANHGRDDQFKQFAARASAECLIAFLRAQIDVEVIPGVDDLLALGTEERLPEDPPPSALLQARYQVIPFHERGREVLLAELERWSDTEPPVAARLLHAEGGAGKTRLAIEWIRRRRALGWAAGFLPKDVPGDWFERLWGLGQQVVVVIDYAGSRSDLRAVLLRMVRYAQQGGAGALRRVRLLMLARNAGDWWQSLRQSDAALEAWLGVTPPWELTPLASEVDERERVFHEAAEHFARRKGMVYDRRTSVSLADIRFRRVLYLHMAALATVEGLEFKTNDLMKVVLDHEERFWETRAGLGELERSFQKTMARQVVAAATLRGGIADFGEAVRMTERILGHTLADESRELLVLLHRVYERNGAVSSMFLPGLEPDLLGEGMVLRVAAPELQEARPPADWIERVFPLEEETEVVASGFEVLGRASAEGPEVLRPWIERLLAGPLHRRGKLALQAAKAVGLRTALSVLGDVLADQLEARGDAWLAHELSAAGIPYPTVSLGRVAEWTNRTCLLELKAPEEEKILLQRAVLQNDRGNSLGGLGQHEEALKATQQSVEFFRVLAQRHPELLQPFLALCLDNLGLRFSALGQRDEALKAVSEAIELRRVLAQREPDAHLPGLASSLTNIGLRLGELGRYEEALQATEEATKSLQTLVQRDPDIFLPKLADSLNNLGIRLGDVGRHEESIDAAAKAVEIYRSLAHNRPDAFLPGLSASLSNLGVSLGALGRHEEALRADKESVELRRALADYNPDAFLPQFACSLNNQGAVLMHLNRYPEALTLIEEAVKIRRDLAPKNPDVILPDLVSSLHNKGLLLKKLARNEAALIAFEEAFDTIWPFFERSPSGFTSVLAPVIVELQSAYDVLKRRMPHLRKERIVACVSCVGFDGFFFGWLRSRKWKLPIGESEGGED